MELREQLAVALIVCGVACSAGPPEGTDAATAWEGTIITEGEVTTVVNESGSVWGGTARLIEEASIGAESGADEYLFGGIHSIFADQRRIYVVDQQVPAVRMYDHDGVFLGDLGAEGQGPGEYTAPSLVTVDDEGRIYVADSRLRRMNVYSAEGESIETWPLADYQCCYMPMYAVNWREIQILVDRIASPRRPAPLQMELGFAVYGAEGAVGEPQWVPHLDWRPVRIEVDGRGTGVRFTPSRQFRPLPSGGFVVGITGTYRFEVHHRDGGKLVVEHRAFERVPLHADEWEWWRRVSVAATRTFRQLPDYDWDGAEMPGCVPKFVEKRLA